MLAIAEHERTATGSERTRATIAAELDRYRARLEPLDPPQARRQPTWPEPDWRHPSHDTGIEMGM